MAVALWTERKPDLRLSRGWSAGIAGAALAMLTGLGYYLATRYGEPTAKLIGDIPAALAFAALALVAIRGQGLGLAWMSWRPLVGLGVISYGFYLWHLPLIFLLRGIYPHGAFIPTFLLAFPLAVAMGVLSWRLIEKPALRWGSSRDRPARRPAPYRPSTARPASQA
jgi:peptidoglycan/LPS O-acetylase OafA/YrhL